MKKDKQKEMVYEKRHYGTELTSGEYKGYSYVILSFGSHPCCYVRLMESDIYANTENFSNIPVNCHGGITYKTENGLQGRPGTWIGWNYARVGDYIFLDSIFTPRDEGKKWSTSELIAECKSVCRQLYNLNHRKENEHATSYSA